MRTHLFKTVNVFNGKFCYESNWLANPFRLLLKVARISSVAAYKTSQALKNKVNEIYGL